MSCFDRFWEYCHFERWGGGVFTEYKCVYMCVYALGVGRTTGVCCALWAWAVVLAFCAGMAPSFAPDGTIPYLEVIHMVPFRDSQLGLRCWAGSCGLQ